MSHVSIMFWFLYHTFYSLGFNFYFDSQHYEIMGWFAIQLATKYLIWIKGRNESCEKVSCDFIHAPLLIQFVLTTFLGFYKLISFWIQLCELILVPSWSSHTIFLCGTSNAFPRFAFHCKINNQHVLYSQYHLINLGAHCV